MKVLELFSGTRSFGKVCSQLGYDVISLDKYMESTHKIDILDFDYKQYPKDYFGIIWSSPDCVNYSSLQSGWYGRKKKDGIFTKEKHELNMLESDKLVKKTIEIIDYFNPNLWFIENPQTGLLKTRDFMKNLNYYDVDYCMYSDFGYRKRTRIWTNKKTFDAKLCNGNCGNIIIKKTDGDLRHDTGKPIKSETRKLHTNMFGKNEQRKAVVKHIEDVSITIGSSSNKLMRYRVPEKLILELIS